MTDPVEAARRQQAAGETIAAMVTARIGGDDKLALDLLHDAAVDLEAVALVALAYVVALGTVVAEEVMHVDFAEWWRLWCAAHAALADDL